MTKISKKEWDKMAKELNVSLEQIYEPEDGVYVLMEIMRMEILEMEAHLVTILNMYLKL